MLTVAFIVVALTLTPFTVASGVDRQEPQDLILREMGALDRALKTTIDAIVQNRLERIPPAFNEVHAIREEVEHAVKGGGTLVLPKNQKRVKEFMRMDKKFHREADILMHAAKKKNMRVVQRQVHRLIDACVRCHVIFKK